ncbi:hypothetical protein EDD85DRAFT_1026600 [Armillaria nabsnona]|nr:hypothetical protein EDD85DRAFT_1026600 [Armillaria nabsnona]
MVVEWSVLEDTCSYRQNDNCTATNIFFVINSPPSDARQNNGSYNNNIPIDPIFIWNSSMETYNNAESNYVTFPTELTLSVTTSANDKWFMSGYGPASISVYPFDYYYADIFAFGQDASTNDFITFSDLSALQNLIQWL